MPTFNLTESNIRDHSALMAHISQLSGGIEPSSELASAADTASHETIAVIQPSSESTSAVPTSTTPNPATHEQSTDYTKAKGSWFYRANVVSHTDYEEGPEAV